MNYNIRDFGAKGDGTTLDTVGIQAAIDCCSKTGGTIHFPEGNYLTGTIFLKSHVILDFSPKATLLGSKNIDDYASEGTDMCRYINESHMDRVLIFARDAECIGLSGRGVIDGQGHDFHGSRPMLMRFVNCRNLMMNDLTFQNGAAWCTALIHCDNVRLNGITISNWVNHNTDGFDLDGCSNVCISNCNLKCKDDAIALQTSDPAHPCRNIVITNCILSSDWAALRMGPLAMGDYRDITMSNCVIHDTFGCALKLQMNEGACIENVLFSNLIMRKVTGPISLSLSSARASRIHQNEPLRPIQTFRNIQFSNIRAEVVGYTTGHPSKTLRFEGEDKACISITGTVGKPVEGIFFSDMHITYEGGGTAQEAARRDLPELTEQVSPEYFRLGTLPAYGLYARHAKSVTMRNVRFDLINPDLRPAVICDDVQDVEIDGLAAEACCGMESLIRLESTQDVIIRNSRPVGDGAETFLKLEGKETRNIALMGNDLRNCDWNANRGEEIERQEVGEVGNMSGRLEIPY